MQKSSVLRSRERSLAAIRHAVNALSVTAVFKYLFFNRAQNQNNRPARNYIQKGQKVSLQNVDWNKNGKTLLLILQKDCHFCTESGEFYQKLGGKAALRPDVYLVAVLPQPVDEGRKYLTAIGVSIADVRQASLSTFPIEGTPTLLMVNESGIASEIWIGKLKPEKEAEVLSYF